MLSRTVKTNNKFQDMADDMELNDLDSDESIADISGEYLSTNKRQKVEKLACHPDEPVPPVVMRAAGQIYHLDCLRCSKCNSNLVPPSAFLISTEPLQLLCHNCVEQIQNNVILCKVCHKIIKESAPSVTLAEEFSVHVECLHCSMCSRRYTQNKQLKFGVMETESSRHCLCNDCIGIVSGGRITNDEISGRIPFEICQSKRIKCSSCNEIITNGFFFVAEGEISCYNCHLNHYSK